jgi:hypothetical protein
VRRKLKLPGRLSEIHLARPSVLSAHPVPTPCL